MIEQLDQRNPPHYAPLLRPLWFAAPERQDYYGISDQFLLGSDLLIAPVMNEKLSARDITLPLGNWRDAWTGKVWNGNCILEAYYAPCPGVPIFIREENKDLFEKIHPLLAEIKRGSIPSGLTTARHYCGLDRDLNVTG